MSFRSDNDIAIAKQHLQLDAESSIFLSRELEQVRSTPYETKYPETSALSLMPINRTVSEGAKTYTYKTYNGVTVAKIITNFGDDLPNVEAFATEDTSYIKSYGNQYEFSTEDLRNAAFAGESLETRKVMLAKRGHDEAINRCAWQGDVKNKIQGFLTSTNMPAVTLKNDGSGTSTKFADKTPAQILRDLNSVANNPQKISKDTARATELWMPLDQYTYISTTPWNEANGSNVTILEMFIKNHPSCKKVVAINELAGAGTGGKDLMIALENDQMNYELIVPMNFKQYMSQMVNLAYKTPCESKFGGVVFYNFLAFSKAEGI
ncbi:MAG: major capsid family protein [Vibrio sp.]